MADILVVETLRLRLRGWHEGDLDVLAAHKGDPEAMKYIGNGETFDRERTAETIRRFEGEWERLGHGRWAIEEQSSGTLIGDCGLVVFREGEPGAVPEVA